MVVNGLKRTQNNSFGSVVGGSWWLVGLHRHKYCLANEGGSFDLRIVYYYDSVTPEYHQRESYGYKLGVICSHLFIKVARREQPSSHKLSLICDD